MSSPQSRRQPWTVRVAAWSARHRWPVFTLWFVATIGLYMASLAAGGTQAQNAVSNDTGGSRYESLRAMEIFDASGTAEPSQSLYLVVATPPGTTADDPATAAALHEIAARTTALQATVDGASVPAFKDVVDPLVVPPNVGLVAPDRTAVRLVATVPGDNTEIGERLEPVPAFVDQLRADYPGFTIHALNNTLANDDISELVNKDLDASLQITIPLTFFILLVAFGAVVAAAVPLILAMTALLAAFGVLGLYSQFVTPVSPYASQLVVLIGLAVAVDYSLFMLTRFRSERRRHPAPLQQPTRNDYLRRVVLVLAAIGALVIGVVVDAAAVRIVVAAVIGGIVIWSISRLMERGDETGKLSAIQTASSTAGRAVFFSGLAVMISIAGLFLLDDPLFRSMAVGTISVVFISVVGSLTFLPAVLAILGDGINGGRLPILGRPRPEGSGMWARIVRTTMRRPVLSFVLSAGFLLALASPALRLHIGQSDFASFPDEIDSVQALNLMNEKWPQGSTLALQVVVTKADQPATKAAIDELTKRLLAIEGLSEPVETRTSQDGTVALVSYVMAGGQNDEANRVIVSDVRRDIVPAVFGGLPDVQAFVTGDAAFTVDVVGFYQAGMPQVFLFVLGLSFLLLLVAFHSIVIPIKAIILNLLSTGAAYGLMVLVFQDGYGASLIDAKPGVIEAFIPVFIFTILFGLSMDYHVFILTRIKEARDHGLSSNAAVERGISITAGTVTSAAVIMVAVFGVFVTLRLSIIKQLGFGLAVAVLLDATVIRSVLLPASMRLLGDWNWWMPKFLSWIPRITIEAETEDEDSEAVREQEAGGGVEEPTSAGEPAGA
jgi:RND superfamily putative drug exporter